MRVGLRVRLGVELLFKGKELTTWKQRNNVLPKEGVT